MISTHSNLASETTPLGYLVHEVARQFRRRFEEDARVHGITLPQWKTLAEVARNEGITQVALAGCIDSDPMTLSGILDRLEKRGFVERYPDPKDSRAKLVRILPDGRRIVEMARALGLDIHARAIEGMSARDQKDLQRLLERMRDNLTGLEAEQKETA